MNTATFVLDRQTTTTPAVLNLRWHAPTASGFTEKVTVRTRPGTSAGATPAVRTSFPATSLAQAWLGQLRGDNRTGQALERIAFGLITGSGLGALGYLAVSAADFTTNWPVFARLVASIFS